MTTIWKYILAVGDECEIEMPSNAIVLTAQMQIGEICLWAMVDTEKPLTKRIFCIRGTGHPIDKIGVYVGTVQVAGGALVWHVFEKV